jgi:hypothetical protein
VQIERDRQKLHAEFELKVREMNEAKARLEGQVARMEAKDAQLRSEWARFEADKAEAVAGAEAQLFALAQSLSSSSGGGSAEASLALVPSSFSEGGSFPSTVGKMFARAAAVAAQAGLLLLLTGHSPALCGLSRKAAAMQRGQFQWTARSPPTRTAPLLCPPRSAHELLRRVFEHHFSFCRWGYLLV